MRHGAPVIRTTSRLPLAVEGLLFGFDENLVEMPTFELVSSILDMSRLDISSCRRKSIRPGAWLWVVWGSALGGSAHVHLPFLSLAQVGYSGRARCSNPDAASRAREEEPHRAAARRASPDGLITHPRAPTPRESPPAPTWAE
jgi:hypothetical protein